MHADHMPLITRADWAARAPKSSEYLASTRGVKVHYTGGTVPSKIVDDHDVCIELVRSFQNLHMDDNGWADLAYSMVACPHRDMFVGRGPHKLPAANGPGLNSGHYAVLALIGNAGYVFPTDPLLLGVWDCIDYLRKHGAAGKEIKGHRDGYSTDCPGDHMYAWIKKGAPRPGGDDTPGNPAWPGRYLSYPPVMRGDDVLIWQAKMKDLGYDLVVDGAYGRHSIAACRSFQRDNHLSDDGIVGPRTWAATWTAKAKP